MSEENMALPEGVTEIYNDFFQLAKLDVSIPKSVVDGGKIVTVDSDMTVKEAVKLLAEHEILSAPVRDVKAPEDASWMDKYTGTIDAINLMYWLLDKEDGVPPDTLHDLLQKEFTDDPIQDVLDADPFAQRFVPFVPLDAENNHMLDVMLLLGKYGLHRAYVVHTCGDIENVITQSTVVKFLNENKSMMVSTFNRTVQELGLGQKEPVSVTRDDTFWTAFKVMKDHGVSAVPVTELDGTICGVVSARDARLMVTRPTRLRFVSQPLSLFDDLHVSPFDHQTVCVKRTSTLEEVVDRLLSTGVHRVFVVDDSQRPEGVISLRDVITCLIVEPKDSTMADYFVQRGRQ
eukprot:m.44503 g.44503  ORF g.44503 m.44503 type:complete len:346 (+) comp10611_c0_seq8:219-1256(+)